VERIVIASLIAATVVGWPADAAARAWQEQSSKTISASGIRSLRVENARGVVAVRPSHDGRVHLQAIKVVRSNDREWAERVSQETRVTVAMETGELVVRVQYPQRQTVNVRFRDLFSDFELPRVEVRLALEVPGRLPVHLKAASGDLETSELDGMQVLETTSGDIVVLSGRRLQASTTSGDLRLERVGVARLKTVSGDVEVVSPQGPLTGESTSGDLVVRGALDSLRLHTVSGDIRVEQAPEGVRIGTTSGSVTVGAAARSVAIETENGDVALELVAPLKRAHLESVAGDLGVRLAGKLACQLDIASTHGEIELELPLDLHDVTRHRVTASVRDGSAPVVLRSTSGDITVSEASR